jgi:hypothetical protein
LEELSNTVEIILQFTHCYFFSRWPGLVVVVELEQAVQLVPVLVLLQLSFSFTGTHG